MLNNTDHQNFEHGLREMNVDDLRKLVIKQSRF